jgi:dihydroorotate dehydrogenase
MPDWSYHTLFKPLLFRMSSRVARNLTLHGIGGLSRIPGGTFVIRTMGHMEMYPQLASELAGVPIACPVGLSGGLDPHGTAHKALAQFGLGFIELGPVTVRAVCSHASIARMTEGEAIVYPDGYENDGVDAIVARLSKGTGHRLPHFVRLRPMPGSSPREALEEQRELLLKLAPYAAGFTLDGLAEGWPSATALAYLAEVRLMAEAAAPGKPLLLYVPQQVPLLREVLDTVRSFSGVVLGDAQREPGTRRERVGGGAAVRDAQLQSVRLLREALGGRHAIVAAGGVHQPQDARELLAAGASCVQLHSGLVYAGPGLPKRINDAILYDRISAVTSVESMPLSTSSAVSPTMSSLPSSLSTTSHSSFPPQVSSAPSPTSGADIHGVSFTSIPAFWQNWGWMSLLGMGMIIGGVLAWLIASTTVLLPYDETFLGRTRSEILHFNQHLLHFMSHDRITLAGTMISIGIFYHQLARHGLRWGLHWARTAVISSCVVGFSSFFLYLGYGYFDPLHALVAVILLPMLLLTLRGLKDFPPRKPPGMQNDRVWLRAQWGQCCFVILGFALGMGGLAISFVGITHVFVGTDLDFLGINAEQLSAWNDAIIPLIAHDRAGFGGALLSLAVAIAATALWGINKGEDWVWWMFLWGGLPGFAAGLMVHFHIGYTDFVHLLPVYIAVMLYVGGLYLTYPYLVGEGDTRVRPVRSQFEV